MQTLQLVWGGRDPELRARGTLGCAAAAGAGRATSRAARRRTGAAYRFLRRSSTACKWSPTARCTRCRSARPNGTPSPPSWGSPPPRPSPTQCSTALPGCERATPRCSSRSRRLLEGQAAAGAGAGFQRRGGAGGDAGRAARHGLRRACPHRRCGARAGRPAMCARSARSGRATLMGTMLPALLAALGGAAASGCDLRAVRRVHRAISPPACSFCRCSSATRRCWSGWRRCSARHRRWPIIWRSIRRRWRACCRRRRTNRRSRLLRSRLRDARLLEDVIGIIRRTVKEVDFSLSVATMEGRLDADAAGRTPQRAGRCRAGRAAAAGAGGFFHALRHGAWRGDGGGAAGQGGRAGDDGRLRPRPDADLRASGGTRPKAAAHGRWRQASGSSVRRTASLRR